MRRATIIFIIIISFFIGISFYVLDPLVAWYVNRQIKNIEFFSKNFHYDNLKVDYSRKTMYLNHFKYHPDDNDFWMEAARLTLSGVNFSEISKSKRLNVDSLIIEHAKLNYNREAHKTPKYEQSPATDLNPFPIKIGNVEFVDSELCIQLDSLRKGCFENFNLIAQDVFMNDFHIDESFTYANFNCKADSVHYADQLMKFIGEEFYLNSKESVSIKDIQIKNSENTTTTNDKKFTVKIKDVKAQLSVSPLIKKEVLKATNIKLDSFLIDFQYDKSLVNQRGETLLPVSAIRALPFSLVINELILQNGTIIYTEKQEKLSSPLQIDFSNVEATVYNVSNDTIMNNGENFLTLNAKAKLLGQSNVELEVDFDNPADHDAHHVYGSFSSFELSTMNKLFKEMALLEFKSGSVDQLVFDFRVNKKYSNGKVDFRYKNLKLLTYKREEDKKIKKRSFLRNVLTNTFAVRTNNPNGNRMVKGTVSLKNNPRKTVFNYWWSAIYDGFEDTIKR